MKQILLIPALLAIASIAFCQNFVAFEENSSLITRSDIGSPISKAFADVNGDFRDDIVRFFNGTRLVVDLQSNNGEFFQSYFLDTIVGDAWTVSVADMDNDGFSDIMSAGNYNGMRVYKNGNKPTDIKRVFTSGPGEYFAQASNATDINNDGLLDYFICDDDGHSEIYLNKGGMFFLRDSAYIDMRTTPESDNSGNYGSVFTDIDGDDDMDLYIAKCRLGVTEYILDSSGVSTGVKDPRRVNMLFINNNGVYEEAAEEWGVAASAQSWTANFGDIDNDGDQDLFIANHEARCQLFENIDNERYEEINPFLDNGDTLQSTLYQTAMADFNNDGFLDILVVGGGDRVLINNGDNTFKRQNAPIGTAQSQSFALGDANADGFVDIIASYRGLGSGLNGARDRFYIAVPNSNNHVAFSLVGNQSNKSGVGAKIQIFGDWGMQTRIVKSGQGYGVTHSLTQRFGLGQAQEIERVKVIWPSGQVDEYQNLDVKKHFVLHEGTCITELAAITTTDSRLNCLVSEATLSIADASLSGTWSNGSSNNTITVTEPDVYNVMVDDGSGCMSPAQSVIVRGPEELEVPKLNLVNDPVLCIGNRIDIGLRNELDLLWSNQELDDEISLTESASIFAVNQNECDTIKTSTRNITFVNPNDISRPDTFRFKDEMAIELTVDEKDVIWFSDPLGMDTIAFGSTLVTDVLSSDSIFFFSYAVDIEEPLYVGGLQVELADDGDFPSSNTNGGMYLVTNEECVLEAFTVNSRMEGLRTIEIVNRITLDTVFSKDVMVGVGVERVELGALLLKGNYLIKANEATNQSSFGNRSPEFDALTGDFNYPYLISDFARVSDALFGRMHYSYFFDLEMYQPARECNTRVVGYPVKYDLDVSTLDIYSQNIEIYPNPFDNQITIKSEKRIQHVEIFNSLGEKVFNLDSNNDFINLDLTGLLTGHYIISMKGSDFTATHKIIKH